MKYFLFLYEIIFLHVIISIKSITFNLTCLSQNNIEEYFPFSLNVCIGTPIQCFNVSYDIASYLLWIPTDDIEHIYPNYFNPDNSSTYKTEHIEIYFTQTDNSISGIESSDNIYFNNNSTLNNMSISFAIANKVNSPQKNSDGNLGLARNYSHYIEEIINNDTNITRFNLVNTLYDNHIITKKCFYHFQQNTTNTILVFGESFNLNNYYQFKCKCIYLPTFPNSFNDFWNCEINNININNINIPLLSKVYAIFATNQQYIIAPYLIGVKIMEHYKQLISLYTSSSTTCDILFSNNEYILQCSNCTNIKELINKLPPITFLINEYKLIVDGKYLIIQKDINMFILSIKANHNNQFWILGNPAISTIPGMMFDYEDNTITFITNKQLSFEFKILILIYINIMVILLSGICSLFIISCKYDINLKKYIL
jgi:hypothetical protein